VVEPLGDEQQVELAFAYDLVRDVRAVALHVPRLGWHEDMSRRRGWARRHGAVDEQTSGWIALL
jgi:hypothetical protein